MKIWYMYIFMISLSSYIENISASVIMKMVMINLVIWVWYYHWWWWWWSWTLAEVGMSEKFPNILSWDLVGLLVDSDWQNAQRLMSVFLVVLHHPYSGFSLIGFWYCIKPKTITPTIKSKTQVLVYSTFLDFLRSYILRIVILLYLLLLLTK